MGISAPRLAHRLDSLLHHADWETPTCVHTTLLSKKTQAGKNLFNFM